MPLRARFARNRFLFLLIIMAAAGGLALGAGFSYLYDFPELDYLRDYRPSTITQVYGRDRQLIAELYQEKRIPTPLSRIPPVVRQAFLDIEDNRFYEHPGVSYRDILRAIVRNAMERRYVQGASTITQQLAKVLFLTPDRTLSRKVREALLALEIERRFTKDEILEFYLNQIYLGSGAFGVEAASHIYFGKQAGELSLAEAATLAGLPKAPARFNPRLNPENALQRRRLVLRRMQELGHITGEQERSAAEEPLRLAPPVSNVHPESAYFVENIRQRLDRRFGPALYRSGLQVHTTLDLKLQRIAHESLLKGVERMNAQRGFAPLPPKPLEKPPRLGSGFQFRVAEVKDRAVRGVIGGYEAVMPLPKEVDPAFLREGDLVLGRVVNVEAEQKRVHLEWQESIQGAVVALDPATGAIRAMVGGTNFRRHPFNRAVQAHRQPGSSFKPIIMAAALANGYTPAHILVDAPFVRRMPGTPKDWKPRNYTDRFYGPVTLRTALEQSLNLATIKLVDQIGPQRVIDYARRLGIRSPMDPFLSLGLGTFEVTPIEFTAAFVPFARRGLYARPYDLERVTDGSNRVLEENVPVVHQAISPETAYQMKLLLRGVVLEGTGRAARGLPAFAAGKTGTTNEFRDAWFVGFVNDIVVGVWVGRDDNKDMGFRASGATAALPVWIDVMKGWLQGRELDKSLPPPPPGINFIRINAGTGLLPSRWCPGKARPEAFVQGTEPTEACPPKGELPRFLQEN
ncbi:MAG: PBP1A family penicillin-binding protein [Candidatus Tectomicrobia bacterium]|uniref:peptidoglycan glycosyltransferase n=1 Tax=Tectimicrobiota bacterium TaxID=2528274 RepID=A0A932HXW3_UNCTE|nr:PBP1A family penicillin-binding protein [Candidatus Tectomicrobia bacterium]